MNTNAETLTHCYIWFRYSKKVTEMLVEQAVKMIQTHERGRQGITRAKIMKVRLTVVVLFVIILFRDFTRYLYL